MSRKSFFAKLRKDLDDAITYGSKKEATSIAKRGLNRALGESMPAEAEYFRAQIKILQNKFVDAIEHLDSAIKANPEDGAAYNDRALCMVELGIIDGALDYFDRGIRVESDYATIYHNKGWLLNNIGRFSEAVMLFKKALRLEPDRAVTYDNLADALYNLGDYKGALAAYEKVISLLKPGSCTGIRRQIEKQILLLKELLGPDYCSPHRGDKKCR